MPPATKAPPTASSMALPGTPGRAGQNNRGALPVAAQGEPTGGPALPGLKGLQGGPQRAWELPTRPVPTKTAGGATGSGVGAAKPSAGKKDLGSQLEKSWQEANAANQAAVDTAVGEFRKVQSDIGREGAALRSGFYAKAMATVERSRQFAIEGAAQLGIALNPFMLAGVNNRASAVALQEYRTYSAELSQAETAQRLQAASGIAGVLGSVDHVGIDPALAANISQQLGQGQAARDALGRLQDDAKGQENKWLKALDQMLNPKAAIKAQIPQPGANPLARPGMNDPVPSTPLAPLSPLQESKVMPLQNPVPPPSQFAPDAAPPVPGATGQQASSLSSTQREAVAFLTKPEVNAEFIKLPQMVQEKVKKAIEAGATVEQIRQIMQKELLFPGQTMVDELEASAREEMYWDEQAKAEAKTMGMDKKQYLEFVARVMAKNQSGGR